MVYNSQGIVVYENSISEYEKAYNVDLSKYPRGIYIIRIVGENFTAAEKITIE